MKLIRYKVENFRSVKDSGWINCSDVTTLVGINEAGKSNLLLALWKLNPASAGKIVALNDMPVSRLSEMRNQVSTIYFITAEFEISTDDASTASSELEVEVKAQTVMVRRYYDDHFELTYSEQLPVIKKVKQEVVLDGEGKSTDETKEVQYSEQIDKKQLDEYILGLIPKFVYYSNYGNLSTRIYLPHAIAWLKGETVKGVDISEDQVRTIRVLFKFVGLNPSEILSLGKDPKVMAYERTNQRQPTPEVTNEDIEKAKNQKEERTILLQSAGSKLTKDFNDWWKQGNYKFRFQADGDYFTIWVSDARRPAEVSLHLRSTGLQWFLSFYLIFLVESEEAHKNTILLLDEAGLTLHPLAQKDLAVFFNSLSKKNQIIHTTHSPFIIDTSNVDRCKVVYVDKDGFTVASDDLRQGADVLNEQSIYAVHAALGLSVSDVLLVGCEPIIVEGVSEQIYLSSIKQVLIKYNKISPQKELVFIPTGGIRGISAVASLLGIKQELPYVIFDSDKSGEDAAKKLRSGLYQAFENKVVMIGKFTKVQNAEIEDIIPRGLLKKGVDRLFNSSNLDDDFWDDCYDESLPIVSQIEDFAQSHNVALTKGWKVELAKSTKVAMQKKECSDSDLSLWLKIFSIFTINGNNNENK